ncbi:hypothetical protein E3T28_14790 [Cryobacterium sinapicolor]|uniref:Uncharacterized protein n=1 Tax=Cryobacterium sinapicolor TaxID=1259236 RepID=A0ABY2ITL4_9MICO|nr:hypothetical protein [Cryobacterium sinapicolor]TFC94566.1 hypothetical protein E3T28_14790 [Cryobacterium sinapicolor]
MAISKTALKNRLHSDFITQVERALVAHKDGRHVGTNSDDTACGACMDGGDMDGLDYQDRTAFLERNIKDEVELMRLRASMNKVEFTNR